MKKHVKSQKINEENIKKCAIFKSQKINKENKKMCNI